ncbi:hypothetical protein NDU88_006018 [Pleurodeles waltl]|uniref:Uncharacterized protein n=1 Tax=Pleurodeles waltl TaxID=8319 RepID=A0AAV7QGS0_PLEWA|nr:hypothetical protein NDU88_006018 [Pleurodeles waltl]
MRKVLRCRPPSYLQSRRPPTDGWGRLSGLAWCRVPGVPPDTRAGAGARVLQFFGTAEETWRWIDTQTTEDRERRPENLHPDRTEKNRHNKASKVGSPSPLEILKERQKAMEAAASLSGSDHGTAKQSQEELEHSDSDKHGPDVTPGTSDCII